MNHNEVEELNFTKLSDSEVADVARDTKDTPTHFHHSLAGNLILQSHAYMPSLKLNPFSFLDNIQ